MARSEAVPHHPMLVPSSARRKPLTRIAQWTLYVGATLAVLSGLAVWPANVVALGSVHSSVGWLVILSLWTLAAIAGRAHVARSSVWLAVGWGLATALCAAAQYQLRAGSWITVLHVATGIGAVVFGQHLLSRIGHAGSPTAAAGPAVATHTMKDAAATFLANKRIAVTGVSRTPAQHGSNLVFRRLRERGYQVFAVNPNTSEVEGAPSFPDLRSIPGGVDAVVIATRPERAMATMRECDELGIKHVWMHRLTGTGSVSEEGAAWGRQRGMSVIAGGCPLMFEPTADNGHKVMRSLLTLTGKLPRNA